MAIIKKAENDALNKALEIFRKHGYIFDKNYIMVLKNISYKNKKHKDIHYFDKDSNRWLLWLLSFFPFSNLWCLYQTIRYLLKDYSCMLGMANYTFEMKMKENIYYTIQHYKAEELLTKDPSFEDRMQLESIINSSKEEKIDDLMKKYDNEDKKSKKKPKIAVYEDDKYDVLLMKMNQLNELIASKEAADKVLDDELGKLKKMGTREDTK